MKTYKAYLAQAGEGCDYTIGCGLRVIDINAASLDEAKIKLIEEIKENYSQEERQVDKVELYEIESITNIDVSELYNLIKQERNAKEQAYKEERERQEFLRLQAKFGAQA